MTIDASSRSDPRNDTPREVTDPLAGKSENHGEGRASSGASAGRTRLEDSLVTATEIGSALADIVDERTVDIRETIDEDEFFSTADGTPTVTNRYDLEKAVPLEKKSRFRELDRYWVNEPYAFVSIFHAPAENERKYYLVEPTLNDLEADVRDFLAAKLKRTIKYADENVAADADRADRRAVIEAEIGRLLERYDLLETPRNRSDRGLLERVSSLFCDEDPDESDARRALEGIEARPEGAILADDRATISEYQVEKLRYRLCRDFVGYERIDGIKHDRNVEDISVDGYDTPVFVYHSKYEQLITNVEHGRTDLDDFVVKLAQRSGNGISKRRPQVDATLPDGSRAQLTLGTEVSDRGTNYTIRQFTDVPYTPVDLVNWHTYSIAEMAFLWLAVENDRNLLLAGGTASGKTTSLNAISLFIPSSAKVVSIEDTREVTLPQRNWIASTTRPSLTADSTGAVDEFDLLEATLRQRPDYIVMGEVRGEEGRTLFQVMSTGHTTCTTFHADSVGEVLTRFTTAPIDVSKTVFSALDLVAVQTQTTVGGETVRRNTGITEINQYDAEYDEINVQDVYQWRAKTDDFRRIGDSSTLEEIRFDRGWSRETLERELFERQVVLAYLIQNGLDAYADVAATIQAYMADPQRVRTLMATDRLKDSLEDLRGMESVLIGDPETAGQVSRPSPTPETNRRSKAILRRADEELFDDYRTEIEAASSEAVESSRSPVELPSWLANEDSSEGDAIHSRTGGHTESCRYRTKGETPLLERDNSNDSSETARAGSEP
ncbi:secretion system protein E [Halostagnicola larsenii XH-48]|uniref:Secretion system protein E n=1 Tax=Halostagnicola larsenii XH-48 TaxID=797299 RepID=W0JP23_9EURY|nr:secretion system protein E [Halostagnicola larsenii XH-48]